MRVRRGVVRQIPGSLVPTDESTVVGPHNVHSMPNRADRVLAGSLKLDLVPDAEHWSGPSCQDQPTRMTQRPTQGIDHRLDELTARHARQGAEDLGRHRLAVGPLLLEAPRWVAPTQSTSAIADPQGD